MLLYQPTLRPLQDSDTDFLMDLFKTSTEVQIYAQMPAKLSQQLLQSQFTLKEQSYTRMYPTGQNNIIEINHNPVGRFFTNTASYETRLVDIAIHPTMRGQGIGSSLIQQLLTDAVKLKSPVRLQVLIDNIEAQRLYHKLGFTAGLNDGVYISYEFT